MVPLLLSREGLLIDNWGKASRPFLCSLALGGFRLFPSGQGSAVTALLPGLLLRDFVLLLRRDKAVLSSGEVFPEQEGFRVLEEVFRLLKGVRGQLGCAFRDSRLLRCASPGLRCLGGLLEFFPLLMVLDCLCEVVEELSTLCEGSLGYVIPPTTQGLFCLLQARDRFLPWRWKELRCFGCRLLGFEGSRARRACRLPRLLLLGLRSRCDEEFPCAHEFGRGSFPQVFL